MEKKKIAVLFGGQSGEHEVSLMSAKSIINNLDKDKYEIYMVGITKKGEWYLYRGDVGKIETGEWEKEGIPAIMGASTKYRGIITFEDGENGFYPIDVVFPVLHGPNGEDGTIQGLLELLDMPYVGANVLSSALCMDKVFTKRIFKEAGLPTPDFVVVYGKEIEDLEAIKKKIEHLGYPCFVNLLIWGRVLALLKSTTRKNFLGP